MAGGEGGGAEDNRCDAVYACRACPEDAGAAAVVVTVVEVVLVDAPAALAV